MGYGLVDHNIINELKHKFKGNRIFNAHLPDLFCIIIILCYDSQILRQIIRTDMIKKGGRQVSTRRPPFLGTFIELGMKQVVNPFILGIPSDRNHLESKLRACGYCVLPQLPYCIIGLIICVVHYQNPTLAKIVQISICGSQLGFVRHAGQTDKAMRITEITREAIGYPGLCKHNLAVLITLRELVKKAEQDDFTALDRNCFLRMLSISRQAITLGG